jgi:hypothetical protein
MPTLLLTRGPDTRAIEVRRCGAYSRLVVRVRSFTLDRALAAGASPDSSALLSLRAQSLISTPHRLALARTLRALIRDAGRQCRPFDPGIPLPRDVLLARESIEAAAKVLESAHAVDARGVAHLELMLRDGGGPLFGAGGPSALRKGFRDAIGALTPPPHIHADA